MTFEEKKNINARINELLAILVPPEQRTDATMLVIGDAEFQTASFIVRGDTKLLAQTIQHHIKENVEFRRLIFATIGSYLSQNPEHEKEFFGGILAIKSNLGVN